MTCQESSSDISFQTAGNDQLYRRWGRGGVRTRLDDRMITCGEMLPSSGMVVKLV